ncbi:MAG: formylglycine-generating enzyme family protein [Acidobacteriaceae bacterium]|nr:formylglycine-generating enzyme family protein [Acidobacteriaceae bacterium]
MSRDSIASDWVLTEADEAKRRGILVPALLDQVTIPFAFRRIHAASLVEWRGTLPSPEFDELVRAVSAVLSCAPGPVPRFPDLRSAGQVRENPKDTLRYVWIPPGKFMMGCSPGDSECFDDEKPPHEVNITRGFWIGQTAVTQAAYERVMKNNPSHFKGSDLPVENVSWNDAKAYCEAVGMRLPTEAEWEYAARAGSTEARYAATDQVAWYSGNSKNQTHPVAAKASNAWGLYDTLGNVWEWMEDWYDSGYYRQNVSIDPSGPNASTENRRVLRGGSWYSVPRVVRVSDRSGYEPAIRFDDLGFRCAGELR